MLLNKTRLLLMIFGLFVSSTYLADGLDDPGDGLQLVQITNEEDFSAPKIENHNLMSGTHLKILPAVTVSSFLNFYKSPAQYIDL